MIHWSLKKTAMMIAVLSAISSSAVAANWWNPTPVLAIGTTSVNVKNFGAYGDGIHDDTAAIQKAIDSLPSAGGTVVVPTGSYMINALTSLNLRSHMRLHMYGDAYLKAIGNNSNRYYIVKAWQVNNVEIVGGNVVGERNSHVGTTGEWGYGINVSGSTSVYVHDIHISNCWGDGILVGAIGSGSSAVLSKNVTLNNVTSQNNRRQGLTIAPCSYLYVYNSHFMGQNGTAPQAGIDIEPQTQGNVSTVRIESVTTSNNVGNGVEMHDNVSGVTFVNHTSQNNQGYGVYDGNADNIEIANSNLSENYLFGVRMGDATSGANIHNNSIMWNGDAWYYAHNVSIYTKSSTPRDISIANTASHITLTNNQISPTP